MTAPDLLRAVVPLAADNFTPLTRTPWAGEVIGRRFKSLAVPGAEGLRIGESWEFSLDPDFPSRLVSVPAMELPALISAWPKEALSPARAAAGCDLLVKILDAAEPLSLQVHPRDDDPNLKQHECGKPESWLVLAARPGSGIYLGFKRAVGIAELRAALTSGVRAYELLHFETVAPGDYFEIEPGVPHAIGAGVTLLEPQRVRAGRAGKTFRMWDWDRRYDDKGQLDPRGKPRALHIDESLALVDPATQHGPEFVHTLRRGPRRTALDGGEALYFPRNSYAQTVLVRLKRGRSAQLTIEDGYAAMVMLKGECEFGTVRLGAGQPAFVPHAALPVRIQAIEDTELALVIPAAARPELS